MGLCSAISFERSRRELSINVAEHGPMLKNYQNSHYPRFSFISKTGIALTKTGVLYLRCSHCDEKERTSKLKSTKSSSLKKTDLIIISLVHSSRFSSTSPPLNSFFFKEKYFRSRQNLTLYLFFL